MKPRTKQNEAYHRAQFRGEMISGAFKCAVGAVLWWLYFVKLDLLGEMCRAWG